INKYSESLNDAYSESRLLCEKRNQVQIKREYFDLYKQIQVAIYGKLEMNWIYQWVQFSITHISFKKVARLHQQGRVSINYTFNLALFKRMRRLFFKY